MAKNADRQRFRNEDLLLKVNSYVDRRKWDESKYEGFLDELCKDREFQKDAIKTSLRYLLAGEYQNLRSLAKSNFESNEILQQRYGSWQGMERHLQLPEQLACSLDLATGVGKSFVIYGIAAILLAEGTVDRVLVLCPSTTIEDGLIRKFKDLASDENLSELLPKESAFMRPNIINARESITEGSICVENYHAILEHVRSSVSESLKGKGARVAVLNDEAHHVANEIAKSDGKIKRWKEFLLNPDYGFRYVVGLSGTCYIGDEYFADVVYRYSLRQAMEEKYVKKVDYIAEMPKTGDPDEKWQLIYNRHHETKKKLKARNIRPLSIIVTATVAKCKEVADELKAYMIEEQSLKPESVDDQVLVIYNNAPDVLKLPVLDQPRNKVEWIISVSMLNEGWDVKRVFQIIPHEERAFNSKLLIAQVLGRGLRIPEGWKGIQPEVTIFNHDAWAPRIRYLVQEILEIERRISSNVIEDSPFHFDLHNIDYTLEPISIKKPMTGEYTLFEKGYVDLATDSPSEDFSIEFERATTGDRYKWQTKIKHKTFSANEIAEEMYRRLEEAQDPDDPVKKMRSIYTDTFPIDRLEKIVKNSLRKIRAKDATESMKQKFLQSLGTLRRKESENVRYKTKVDRYTTVSTKYRQSDSLSASELRNTKTLYYTDSSREQLIDEQIEFFDEAIEEGSGYKTIHIANKHDFKTPLNVVIADYDNERKFMNHLLKPENIKCYDAWIKSTSIRFYEIDYAWKKGEHPKRGKFNPDIFLKINNLIIAIEIKGDEELRDPSDENKKKNEFAIEHFIRVNKNLEKEGSDIRYKFTFLTEKNFNIFFQRLREGKVKEFRSELDVKLVE